MNKSKATFVGIGNTLAGDDGAGITMVRELESRLSDIPEIAFRELPGDLYEIWDLIPFTESFVFLDAVAGDVPGEIFEGKTACRGFSASFHQEDLCSVIKKLELLCDEPFPEWTLWGVTINPPETLGEGLSGTVQSAVDEIVHRIELCVRGDGLTVGENCIRN